jgi:hypothetical protein
MSENTGPPAPRTVELDEYDLDRLYEVLDYVLWLQKRADQSAHWLDRDSEPADATVDAAVHLGEVADFFDLLL